MFDLVSVCPGAGVPRWMDAVFYISVPLIVNILPLTQMTEKLLFVLDINFVYVAAAILSASFADEVGSGGWSI